jgi:DNA-binding MarR family transcriptional regulator
MPSAYIFYVPSYKLFTNVNNFHSLQAQLEQQGLTADEARIYVELLRQPATHLALSRVTGINRTKVYRIVQDLIDRSLVTHQTDDRGTFVTACDPSGLELQLLAAEEAVMTRRSGLQQLLPTLHELRGQADSLFTTRTYEGAEGLKQMCWHELKAKELLLFGSNTIVELIPSRYWAERQRALSAAAGYQIFELANAAPAAHFTANEQYLGRYQCRLLPADSLLLRNQIAVYNDTVAIYHWDEEQKSGVEIINAPYATMMRQLFWAYWAQALPVNALH